MHIYTVLWYSCLCAHIVISAYECTIFNLHVNYVLANEWHVLRVHKLECNRDQHEYYFLLIFNRYGIEQKIDFFTMWKSGIAYCPWNLNYCKAIANVLYITMKLWPSLLLNTSLYVCPVTLITEHSALLVALNFVRLTCKLVFHWWFSITSEAERRLLKWVGV